MKIGNIFSNTDGINQVGGDNTADKVKQIEDSIQRGQDKVRNGEDSISISPLARQLMSIQKVLEEDSASRAERVSALKESIQAGNYNVSSSDVAQSIVSFLEDNE